MTVADFERLIAPEGQHALSFTNSWAIRDDNRLAALQNLRKWFDAPLANAVLETILLRQKAVGKFADAGKLCLTRESLEQSSGDAVANYRASRFAPSRSVLDIGCGIGGDLMAFARAGLAAVGLERDDLRAAMATANLAACGLPGRVIVGDALTVPTLELAEAAFCDPARRTGDRRVLDPADSQPPPMAIIARLPADFPLAFKLAPGIDRHASDALGGETEFVSVDGELKECLAWRGPLATARRRATAIRDGVPHTISSSAFPEPAPLGDLGEFLYDPDPAVVRSEMTGPLATTLALTALDARVATLTGPAVDSPFLTRFRVVAECDLDEKKGHAELRARGVGRVTIVKRGVEADADRLRKRWTSDAPGHATVFLTPIAGRPRAIIGDRE